MDITRLLDEIGALFPVRVRKRLLNRNYHRDLAIFKQLSPLLKPGKQALDIGIGSGVIPLVLRKLDIRVVGLDTWEEYSAEYDSVCGEKKDIIRRLKGNGIELLYHNVERGLPFQSNSFDMVLFLDVIEHLRDLPKGILEEIWRVLKIEGCLIITMPNLVNLRNRILFSLGKSPYVHFKTDFSSSGKFFGHRREYTVDELHYMLKCNNFDIISTKLSNCFQIPSPAGNDYYERDFKLNSPERLVTAVYLLGTSLFPRFRYYVIVTARKRQRQSSALNNKAHIEANSKFWR